MKKQENVENLKQKVKEIEQEAREKEHKLKECKKELKKEDREKEKKVKKFQNGKIIKLT